MPAARRPARRHVALPSALVAAILALAAVAAGRSAVGATAVAVSPDRTWQLPMTPAFEPLDVALLPDGRLAIADGRSHSVLLFDSAGRWVGTVRGNPNSTPVAIAGNPLDGSWWVVWRFTRDHGDADPLEPAPDDGRSDRMYAWVEQYGAHDQSLIFRIGTTFNHVHDGLLDVAVRPLDGRMVVHPIPVTNPATLLPSGVVATGSVRPRIAVWRNNWLGFSPGNGRPFEVYDGVTTGPEAPRATLRRAITLTGEVPIAVAANHDVRFHVLVRPDGTAPPAGGDALVRIIDADLSPAGAVRLEDTPTQPPTEWPWALDVGTDGDYAVSTAGEHFEVVRSDASGQPRFRLVGARARARVDPPGARNPVPQLPFAAAVAAAGGGVPVAVDRTADVLFTLGPDGVAAALRRGTPAIDVAAIDGATFTLDEFGRIRRFDRAGQPDAAWSAVAAPGGARIAAAGGHVVVAQPVSGTIVAFDAASGAVVARHAHPSAGAWPDDLAITADGAIYAIDARQREMTVLAPSGAVAARWPVGLASAPRFVAVADIPGGRVAVVATDDGTIERYDAASGAFVDRWQPSDANGVAFAPGDVAVGPDGTVYAAQTERGAVHAYAPTAVPPATPPAAATPGPRSCVVRGTKGAAPQRIVLGESVDVSITLRAACPDASRFDGADVLLVFDRSGSMDRADKLPTAKEVAQRLARAFAGAPHRVGLVTFAAEARLDAPLTAGDDATAGLADVAAEGSTDIAAALALAHATLGADRRPRTVPIAVVVTDGRSDTAFADDAMAADGIVLATVAVGADASTARLSDITAAPDLAFLASAPGAAAAIHRRLLATVYGTVAVDWTVDDALGAQVELVPNSPRPAAAFGDDLLRWARPILPPGGITLTYRVRPLTTGLVPTNRFAWADYTDADGARRRHVLPMPVVEVIAPTATPTRPPTLTPTPTPTATPTPVPPAIYLPLALTERCRGSTRPIDAVLVIDASTSMLERAADGRTKLAAAQAAVGPFLDSLRLAQGDRAAIVSFHQSAAVVAPLTGDRDRLNRALVAIRTERQTCLVCGVDAALQVVTGDPGRPGRQAVIVLLTDGRSNPRPASEAVASAAAAKAAGVAVYTIGLGLDLDVEALAAIASSPRAFFRTVDAGALEAIYRDIARELPCPAGSFWGRR